MQEKGFFTQSKAPVALCIVLLVLAQQVCAGPLVLSNSDHGAESRVERSVHTPRRIARMTPLWRIMNSKPFGAYCQNNYECSTGICRAGHCSTTHRTPSEPVNY
ncbi:liver-expressed antimicrobial peptide 2 [Mugil cephalus]|uniref:liver-expressed antimicrobial peptide 2 n=1 Tax=Mugil cephalus TaxID=48193 RepID=UPI001FB7D47C|nr:liver-expressed antimicrobial peptide 2 [Mugil cephalus]